MNQPIFINPKANGIHGFPINSGFPIISLIRHPISTVYSFYRLQRDRFNFKFTNKERWIQDKLKEYLDFYSRIFQLKEQNKSKMIILNFEDLVSDEKYIYKIVEFINVEPKLDVEFVYNCTKIQNFFSAKKRTFYREGDNLKWLNDIDFIKYIKSFNLNEFDKFGYKINL